MKKIILTILAVGFGATVSFAQVTGTERQEDHEQADEIIISEREAVQREGQEVQRMRLSMQDLPEEVQDGFQESEFAQWEVLGIYELSQEEAVVEVEENEGKVYAFELMEQGQAQQDGEAAGGVVVRQPDTVVHFDEDGEKLKSKDPQKIRDRNID